MELQLNRDSICINEIVFDGTLEQSIELDYLLPDYCQSIFKVLKCRITPKITSSRVQNGKLFLDGRETSFFFFQQDYFWILADNSQEGIDSRHLGLIPADQVIGHAWFCWFSKDKQRRFKWIH